MTGRYVYAVDDSVVEIFASRKGRERDQLLRIFKGLADDPFQKGDYVQRTQSGRELQVRRFGPWLVTFWADHAVCELRIIDLKKLVG